MARTVLIVEDEADLAGLLSDVLRSAGYSVALTTAGRAAERSLEVGPDAVVVDYLMPGLNGAEVINQIRADAHATAPPVVLVTGLPNARELAEQVGAAGYLRKPFDVDAFIGLIDRVIASRR